MTDTHHICLVMLAVLGGSLLLAGIASPRFLIRCGCRLIAFGEGSAFLRREAWRLWWDFTRDFRLRTEELRQQHRVAEREVSGLEREA